MFSAAEGADGRASRPVTVTLADGASFELDHGAVVIASITSCTNTSNPSVMLGAALLAKNAVDRGLTVKPWVKTSMAPGSKVVTDYYERAGLWPYLEKLGYHLVGYGCTTCIGNSGPLPEEISAAVNEERPRGGLRAVGQPELRGPDQPGRQDELPGQPAAGDRLRARRHDGLRLRDPAAGHRARRQRGLPARHLADGPRRPGHDRQAITEEMFTKDYADVFAGDERWRSLPTPGGQDLRVGPRSRPTSASPRTSTAWRREPSPVVDISGARVLAKLGDSVTTDHISPAGSIKADTPAGQYLVEHGVEKRDFNSYGSRRGNHEVMIRGTFANIRLRNQLLDGVSGGYTRDFTQDGRRRRSSTTPRATTSTPASRWWSWAARSTARGRRATGRPRAPRCSASRP